MKKTFKKVSYLYFTLFLFNCQNYTKDKEAKDLSQFPLPVIPSIIVEKEESYFYMIKHYWDEFDISDSIKSHNEEILKEGLIGYAKLLSLTDSLFTEVKGSINSFCKNINNKSCNMILDIMEEYLYNPNSPYCNEVPFAYFLKEFINNNEIKEEYKIRPEYLSVLINKNKQGSPASPFNFFLPDGTKTNLYNIKTKGKHIILLFYDPECNSCHQTLYLMKSNYRLKEAIDSEKISVIAIYTEGNKSVWERSIEDMPSKWILGTDRSVIKQEAIYDLKAMPSIYLLDSDKNIILKDAEWAEIMYYLDIAE